MDFNFGPSTDAIHPNQKLREPLAAARREHVGSESLKTLCGRVPSLFAFCSVVVMPALKHEAIVRLFRNRPELAPELLRGLEVPLPAYSETRIESADLTHIEPAEYRADTVVLLGAGKPKSKPVLGIVAEVQLSRQKRKRFTWPVLHDAPSIPIRVSCMGSGPHGEREHGQVVPQTYRIRARQRLHSFGRCSHDDPPHRRRGRRRTRPGAGRAVLHRA